MATACASLAPPLVSLVFASLSFAAGLVQSATGFGGGLVFVSGGRWCCDVHGVISLTLGMFAGTLSVALVLLWRRRGSTEHGDDEPPSSLAQAMLACAVPGTVLGHVVHRSIDEVALTRAVGAFLILAVAAEAIGAALSAHAARRRSAELACSNIEEEASLVDSTTSSLGIEHSQRSAPPPPKGFSLYAAAALTSTLGGFLGGFCGTYGPPLMLFFKAYDHLSKGYVLRVATVYGTVVLVVRAALYASEGTLASSSADGGGSACTSAQALEGTFALGCAGSVLGIQLHDRVSQVAFHRALSVLIAASGVAMVV